MNCKTWGSYICPNCFNRFEFIETTSCFYSDHISFLGRTHEHAKRPLGLDGVLSLFYYTHVAKPIIRNIKYKLVRAAFHELFTKTPDSCWDVLRNFKKHYQHAYIQPIPLHVHRFNKRGFNQADIIAQYFQQILDMPMIDSLVRVKDTKAQVSVQSRLQRFYNIHNAFRVRRDARVDGKSIVLVDDVITTGNTAKEATKTLKKCGAKEVFVFTLAKG